MTEFSSPIDYILVAQGAEYQAVCRGLKQSTPTAKPLVVAMPMGVQPLCRYLEQWVLTQSFSPNRVSHLLVMGLCGSLSPAYQVGDIVLYDRCLHLQDTNANGNESGVIHSATNDSVNESMIFLANRTTLAEQICDRVFRLELEQKLSMALTRLRDVAGDPLSGMDSPAFGTLLKKGGRGDQASEKYHVVSALTTDRVIPSAIEKRNLGQRYPTEVVDMEGFAALTTLRQALPPDSLQIGMIRVVSDGCDRDLPDLSSAISPDGVLQPLPLAVSLLQRPLSAIHLIRGSLRGLHVLEQVTTRLFST